MAQATTEINVFSRAVVHERKIPFEVVYPEPEITREKAMQAFMPLMGQSEKNFPQGMLLYEINEEITVIISKWGSQIWT